MLTSGQWLLLIVVTVLSVILMLKADSEKKGKERGQEKAKIKQTKRSHDF